MFAVLILSASSAYAIPAFPGAEGYGAESTGGRGGDVYHVTSLADDFTPGTLRYGIYTAPGYSNRTIVFDISGAISLTYSMYVYGTNITIAGQTAPGQGICLEKRDTEIYGNDLIIRHIRSRLGDDNTQYDVDAIGILYGHDIIVDHCSASWSLDEVFSATKDTTGATIQYCYIAEALNLGNHSYGSLFRPDVDCNLSVHHNLYADNRSRNPRPGTYGDKTLNLDFRNNVIYNWLNECGYSGIPGEYVNMNYAGNYCIAGPSTGSGKLTTVFDGISFDTAIYQSGNKVDGDRDGVIDGTDGGWGMFVGTYTPTGTSFSAPAVYTQTADAALATVLTNVGAFPWNRDTVDANVTSQVLSGGTAGAIYNTVADAGGWPTYPVVTRDANFDTDRDGMANTWEIAHGLDPNVADNNGDFDNDGYTNLEEYLNELAPIPAPKPIVWAGGTGRYELITHWDIPWQPTLADQTEINSGKATVDSIDQEAGTLWVANAIGSNAELAVTGGKLTVGTSLILGGTTNAHGTLTISGGTLDAGNSLVVGGDSAAGGTVNLSGGLLRSIDPYIGAVGTGIFSQSGGTHLAYYLYLGTAAGASGTYNLSGGSLRTEGDQYVGVDGQGNFVQSGGTNAGGQSLHLGYDAGAHGTYDLSNGSLSTWSQWVGTNGTGTFNQSGGTNMVTTWLALGADSGARGTYDLSGGSLRAKTQWIGYLGVGNFSQSGGTNIVTDLFLGLYGGSDGTYTLSGGSLGTIWSQNVGYGGRGTFNQSGGTNLVRLAFYAGGRPGSDGIYNLSGGLMTGGSVILGYDGNTRGRMNLTGGSLAVTGPIILAGGTASTAELKVGKDAYVQASGLTINSGDGRSTQVTMEVAADGNSLIQATGAATLAGPLDLQSLDGFRPQQGQAFTLITSAGMSGDFDSITTNLQGLLRIDRDDPNAGYRPAFSGAVVGTDYVVTFQGARAGDASGDNRIDSADLSALGAGWLQTGGTFNWLEGDFNGDGQVDGTDLALLGANWMWEGAWPGPAPADVPIPEPATLVLLALGGLALLRGRRRFEG
jgi:hypothetical protein